MGRTDRDGLDAGTRGAMAALLEALRSGAVTRADLVHRCTAAEGDDKGGDDALSRYRALLALQYEGLEAPRPEDHDLVRFLAAEEVRGHEATPIRGVPDALRLATWLLARFGDPEDVWAKWRAKTGRFEAEAGLDWEVVLGPKVAATLAHVEASDHPSRPVVLGDLEPGRRPRCAQADVDRAWLEMARDYPCRLSEESLLRRAQVAELFGHLEESRALLHAAEADPATPPHELAWVAATYRSLGDHDRADRLEARLHADR